MRELGLNKYFSSGWNAMDILNYFFFVIVMGLRAQQVSLVFAIAPEFATTERFLGEVIRARRARAHRPRARNHARASFV